MTAVQNNASQTPGGQDALEGLPVVIHRFLSHKPGRDYKTRCQSFIKTLPSPLVAQLETWATEVSFQRRNYGRGHNYCWACHPVLQSVRTVDPWPAIIYPHAVLLMDLLHQGVRGGYLTDTEIPEVRHEG